MLPPLPRCSRWSYSSLKLAPSISAFPDSTIASACTSSFSRFARRSLALRPADSLSHQIRDRYPGASDISSPPCLPRLLPAGAIAGGALHPLEKRRLVTAHVEEEPLRPGVQYGEHANGAADPARIAGQHDDRLGGGLHQRAVAVGLMPAQRGPQFLGHGDGDVEIGNR